MRRGAWCLALGLWLAAGPLAAWTAPDPPVPPSEPEATFSDAVDVALLTMVVRAVDTWGNPILGLQPQDFRVRVGKKEVPVVALDWISQSEPGPSPDEAAAAEPSTLQTPADRAAEPTRDRDAELPADFAITPPAGRLVVVFVQSDFHPSRIRGQMRLRPHTRELLGTLLPSDRVAVVSFDSHLKLWQDFSDDVEATLAAIDTGALWSLERPVDPAQPLSLARHFDYAAARDAASPERALEIVARALQPLPGEKTILFLGWGIGQYTPAGVSMRPAYKPALRALYDAQASVFVLDTSSADSHSLEVGLQDIAAATGGAYFSTFRLPALATRTLARAISGYYVLALDGSALGDEQGLVSVELRGKRGTVLTRPVARRAPPS